MIYIDADQLRQTPDLVAILDGLGLEVLAVEQDEDILLTRGDGGMCCIEMKVAGKDLAMSAMNGHLAVQVDRAVGRGYWPVIVATYGGMRENADGEMVAKYQGSGDKWARVLGPRGKSVQYRRVVQSLLTITMKRGAVWLKAENLMEMCKLVAEYHYWLQTPLEGHKSDEVVYSPVLSGKQAALVARVAKELPRIGVEKAQAAAERWGSVEAMVRATWEEWAEIEGIGEMTAKSIVLKTGWKAAPSI